MTNPLAWQALANCATTDPEVMFPVNEVKGAKRICAPCTVREICLAYSLATGQEHGVWGGETVNARRRMNGWRAPVEVA